MNKKIILIVLTVLVVVLVIIFIIVSQISKNTTNTNSNLGNTSQNTSQSFLTRVPNNTSPKPTIFQDTQEYKDLQEKIALTEAPIHDRGEKVGKLLEKVPYQGQNFVFVFDNSTYSFKVTISNDKQQEGNQEFDEFLKTNGIQERAWIQDLVVEYK